MKIESNIPVKICKSRYPLKSIYCDFIIVSIDKKDSPEEYEEEIDELHLKDEYDDVLAVSLSVLPLENKDRFNEMMENIDPNDIESLYDAAEAGGFDTKSFIIGFNICSNIEGAFTEDGMDSLLKLLDDNGAFSDDNNVIDMVMNIPEVLMNVAGFDINNLRQSALTNIIDVIKTDRLYMDSVMIEKFTETTATYNDTYTGSFTMNNETELLSRYSDKMNEYMEVIYTILSEIDIRKSFLNALDDLKPVNDKENNYLYDMSKTEYGCLYYLKQGLKTKEK